VPELVLAQDTWSVLGEFAEEPDPYFSPFFSFFFREKERDVDVTFTPPTMSKSSAAQPASCKLQDKRATGGVKDKTGSFSHTARWARTKHFTKI